MSDPDVRVLTESEYRAASDLFLQTLLVAPMDDERWAGTKDRYEAGRVLGAHVDGELVGTVMSMSNDLTVPGGRRVPAAAVTGVGVRADRTRRGLLTALMREQLDDAAARGEVVAMLHASEAVIYERFGYGPATRCREVEIDRGRARLRETAPRGGRVRILPREQAGERMRALYQACRDDRAGLIDRPDAWWPARKQHRTGKGATVAVHSDESGADDGYVLYEPAKSADSLEVYDLVAADATAAAELWRFLFGVDLVGSINGHERPLDEPIEWLLADSRACRTTNVGDDLWLRLLDVPTALRARSYGPGDPVVIEVRDAFLPANAGRYRITAQGAESTDAAPDLGLDVAVLAVVYLGDRRVTDLAAAGLVEERTPASAAAADALFVTARSPWCGTGF
ncbi:GNAT family N-acetyltransferase [Saccharopolyspora griseoalba]|uniref:GNAT family N-acetyltransferase n=1 Tax=Saccharopolyspora griseoalba TaxID=1431848 RepID=A0ABW2LNL5_9PSEU